MSTRAQEQRLIRQAKNEYMKEWRRKNSDKVKANTDRYWLKKAIELKNEVSLK